MRPAARSTETAARGRGRASRVSRLARVSQGTATGGAACRAVVGVARTPGTAVAPFGPRPRGVAALYTLAPRRPGRVAGRRGWGAGGDRLTVATRNKQLRGERSRLPCPAYARHHTASRTSNARYRRDGPADRLKTRLALAGLSATGPLTCGAGCPSVCGPVHRTGGASRQYKWQAGNLCGGTPKSHMVAPQDDVAPEAQRLFLLEALEDICAIRIAHADPDAGADPEAGGASRGRPCKTHQDRLVGRGRVRRTEGHR